jgi:TorA maturation chaperone TorD
MSGSTGSLPMSSQLQQSPLASARPSSTTGARQPGLVLALEEEGRAGLYFLIGRLLLSPDCALMARLADPTADELMQQGTPLGLVLKELMRTARELGSKRLREEFETLFISAGTPRINPYESFYMTGFMMEKPLAVLRQELQILGLSRVGSSREPEDHLGILCEVMSLLIVVGEPLKRQQAFFETHIAPWYLRCLNDMAAVPGANFYLLVTALIEVFFDIEIEAFDMAVPESADPVFGTA